MKTLRYRYRYLGPAPVATYDPPAEWQPGQVREVADPISHPLFAREPERAPERPNREVTRA